MPKKRQEFIVCNEGRITTYPTLHETKEKSKIKGNLKKLMHIRKGH
jgi:hypothetical protein